MMIIDLAPALHEAGKIKIGTGGEERTARNGKTKYRQPVKLDHFLITTTDRGGDGNFIIEEEVMKKLKVAKGAKGPTEVPIRLLFDSIEENFDTSYSMFVGGKCLCRGPGTGGMATRRKTEKVKGVTRLTGETEDVPCGEQCEFYLGGGDSSAKCKAYGILACILEDALNVGGVYKFRTTSRKTIQVILSGLQLIQYLTGGILAGLPLVLRYGKRPVTIPATGKKTTAPVVHIAFRGDAASLRVKAGEIAGVRSKSQLTMNELRGRYARITMLDTPEDEAAVNEEFHPDTMGEDVRDTDGGRDLIPPSEPPDMDKELADAPWNAAGKPEATPPSPNDCVGCGIDGGGPLCPDCQAAGYAFNPDTGELWDEDGEPAKRGALTKSDELRDGERAMLDRGEAEKPPPATSAMDW